MIDDWIFVKKGHSQISDFHPNLPSSVQALTYVNWADLRLIPLLLTSFWMPRFLENLAPHRSTIKHDRLHDFTPNFFQLSPLFSWHAYRQSCPAKYQGIWPFLNLTSRVYIWSWLHFPSNSPYEWWSPLSSDLPYSNLQFVFSDLTPNPSLPVQVVFISHKFTHDPPFQRLIFYSTC